MGLTKVSGEVIQSPLNVGIVTASRIDGNVSGDVNSTGVSTFTTLKVGTGVTIGSGIVTATSFVGNITGNVTGNATGLSGTPNITVGNIIASSATISGNVSVAGTLTYEDVTNVDSLGIVTARTGVRIDAGGLVVVGVTTVAAGSVSAPSITPTGDSNTGIFFPSADTIAFGEGGAEALRIDSSGNLKLSAAATSILNSSGNKILNQTGSILQVVSDVISTSTSTTSSSFVDTSVLLAITPSSSSSKVLVMFGLHVSTVSANAYLSLNLLRDSTTIFTSNELLFAAPTANIDQYRTVAAHTYLDSPATTSSTTYKLQIKSHYGTTTVEVNRGGKSTITLMEVAA